MAEKKQKAVNGVRREVTFQAWCKRCPMGWKGPLGDSMSFAAFQLTCHDVDVHGGAFRGAES